MKQFKRIEDVQSWIHHCHEQGLTTAFVPTMGDLHAGHLTLIEAAQQHADKVIVSIFVNPLQFSPMEDFSRYPRILDQDLQRLQQQACDAVFLPTEATLYPEGKANVVKIDPPAYLNQQLCAISRPHFFTGVVTVIHKLFDAVPAKYAFFGEKDYQQLLIIKKVAQGLPIDITIHGVPTQREPDGLAMSSRNRYLDATQRQTAGGIYKVMAAACVDARNGVSLLETAQKHQKALQDMGFVIDYFEFCHADDLSVAHDVSRPVRLFVAVLLDVTRLIDNLAV